MACDSIPKIKNKEGQEITVPLYTDLQKIVGDSMALHIFNLLNSEELKNTENYEFLEFDEYGFPTIESVKKYTDLYSFVDKIRYGNNIAKDIIGTTEFKMKDSTKTMEVLRKIVNFNTNNSFAYAIPTLNTTTNSYGITIVPVNSSTLSLAMQLEDFVKNAGLYEKAMREAGFSSNFVASQISFHYGIKYPKQLNTANFNPKEILESALQFKQLEGINRQQISSLLKNDFYGDIRLTRLSGEANEERSLVHIYNYLKENELIKPDVTYEQVKKENKYIDIAINAMLAETLSNGFSLLNEKINKALLERIKVMTNAIKEKINKLDVSSLVPEQSQEAESFKREVKISFKPLLKKMGVLSNVSKKIETSTQLMEKLIEAEYNRYNLAVRTGDNKSMDVIKKRINNLQQMQESNTLNLAFMDYLQDQAKEIEKLHQEMQKAMASESEASKSYKVRKVIQICNYYTNCIAYFNEYMTKATSYQDDLLNEIQGILRANDIKGDIRVKDTWDSLKKNIEATLSKPEGWDKSVIETLSQIKALMDTYENIVENPIVVNADLNTFTSLTNSVYSEAQKNALMLTADFLKKVQTESATTIPWGRKQGEAIDIEKELVDMRNDINLYDMYLDAMADCPDVIGRLTDKAIKTVKTNVRIDTEEKAREIMKEAALLKQAGIKDFSWLYQRNAEGKKTREYVKPNSEEYNNNIATNPAKLRFYNYFMGVKHTIDKYYPNNAANYTIIGIRKDRLERLKRAGSVKDFFKEIWEGVKDNYVDREDDIEIQGYTEAFTDIGGNEVKLLPVYYNNVTDANADHMSEDAVTTLIAYAYRGIEYHNMASLVNSIELEREVLKQRNMPVESQGKKVLNAAKKMFYKNFGKNKEESQIDEDDLAANTLTTKDLGKSNFYKRWDAYIDATVYGRERKNNGHIGPISTSKLIDQLNKKTAIASLSLNLLNGISNVATGLSMTRIESFCSQYFSPKDLAWADKEYWTSMPGYLAEKGNRIKSNKLHLFIEMFDVLQDFDTEISHKDWMRDTWFKRICNSEFLSVIQNAGENYMNVRIALALAHSIKLKTLDGKETNLYEMLDVEYLQEDGTYGSENKKLGARLKLKEPCVDSKGIDFKLDNATIHRYTRKMAGINQGVHGIYNKQDANMIQQYAIGRLLYMFRKWIPKSLDKRFANLKYNYDIDEWTEGYYQSLFWFLYNCVKEHQGMKLEIAIRWNQLDERQRANCKRALTEIGQFFGLLMLNNYGFRWMDDDKSDYSWAMNMLYYQSIRLQSELAALEPLSVFGSKDNMITEFIRLFKNPIAALSPVSDAQKLTQLLYPSTWTDVIQRGPYKGHSRAFAVFWGNKFLFPIGAMIPKNVGPENYVGYYLNN